jgi:hypothetical protein
MKILPLVFLVVVTTPFEPALARHASKPKAVQGSGCVEKAVENSCRVVIDSQTGELYNLRFSDRIPAPGTAIQFAGTEHIGASSCAQGKPVNVSKWKKEKGIRCPPPAVLAQASH